MFRLVVGFFLITVINLPVNGAENVTKFHILRRLSDMNEYLLYTRNNPDSPQYLYLGDENSILDSNFDPQDSTAVLIHGWQSFPNYGLGPLVKRALLGKDDYNVIIVDWKTVSHLDYLSAVNGVPMVGESVGTFLEFLSSVTGVPYSSMHLIGHSLGAHVSGNAARLLGGQIARITACDPAGPGWYTNEKRLNPSDAIYVEAIHTNAGGLGIEANVGHVDFYPNGGSLQPGCSQPICHHGRSYQLLAASIENENHLIGKECSGFIQMEFNMCRGSKFPLGNDDLQKYGKGMYRLNTGGKYPF